MSDALSGVTSTLPWSQSKKTEGTGPTTTPPPTSKPTTEPGASEPMPTTQPDPVPPAKTYSSSPDANAVSPMSDRLRDLIVEYKSQGAPVATSLHTLVLGSAGGETPLAPEQVQRTRAEIIAAASASLVAQANHTGDSVRALLRVSAAA